MVETNGFHCLDFSTLSSDTNVLFTMISAVESDGTTSVSSSSSSSSIIWHVLGDPCNNAVEGEVLYEVCAAQTSSTFLLEVDWNAVLGLLTASGDNAPIS